MGEEMAGVPMVGTAAATAEVMEVEIKNKIENDNTGAT
jgi:hypothetical protein